MSNNFGKNIVYVFTQLQLTVKIYHWQTENYARHKAADDLYESITDLSDKFIEIYMGKYGRPNFNGELDLRIKTELGDGNVPVVMLKQFIDWFDIDLFKYISKTDTDLINIRDEIVGKLNQTLYLFTLV